MKGTNFKDRPKVYVTKIHSDAVLPFYGTEYSAGMDICICESVIVYPGQTKLLRTGLVVKPPMGYYYDLLIRSSIAKKNPGIVLANGVGVIDADYYAPEDEIKILLLNTNTTSYFSFNKGDRIAQLVLRKLLQPEIKELSLEEIKYRKKRGGFGSTDG